MKTQSQFAQANTHCQKFPLSLTKQFQKEISYKISLKLSLIMNQIETNQKSFKIFLGQYRQKQYSELLNRFKKNNEELRYQDRSSSNESHKNNRKRKINYEKVQQKKKKILRNIQQKQNKDNYHKLIDKGIIKLQQTLLKRSNELGKMSQEEETFDFDDLYSRLLIPSHPLPKEYIERLIKQKKESLLQRIITKDQNH